MQVNDHGDIPAGAPRRRREILAHFLAHDAITPETAVPYEPRRGLDTRLFGQLRTKHVIRQDNRGGFYVDVPMQRKFEKGRKRRAVALMAVAAGAIAALFT